MPEDIQQQLKDANVPLDQWGTGEAKSLIHLIREIDAGECTLSEVDGVLHRRVVGAHVLLSTRHLGQTLYLHEDHQLFHDGRKRHRRLDASIGEKMLHDEKPIDAVHRAFQEELGIEVDFPIEEGVLTCKTRTSKSYPGLISDFVTWEYEVLLPERHWRETYIEVQDDKTTVWVWRDHEPNEALTSS